MLDEVPRIGIAVSGRSSCEIAGRLGDFVIAIEPEAKLIEMSSEAGGERKPGVAQHTGSWATRRSRMPQAGREQFRWAPGGWKVQAELPNPVNFDAASFYVTAEDMAGIVPCGPDAGGIVEGVRQFVEAGFERVALVQIGVRQEEFCELYESELGDALRRL